MNCQLGRRERLFFIDMPILIAGMLIVVFFVGTAAAKDWSETKFFLVGMLVCVVYTAFVVCPLLILAAPPKKEKHDE